MEQKGEKMKIKKKRKDDKEEGYKRNTKQKGQRKTTIKRKDMDTSVRMETGRIGPGSHPGVEVKEETR